MAETKTKEYKIVINGLEQSISQVEALNKQLDSLESRINALSSKAINITATSTSSSGGGGRKVSELQQEDKLLKQIAQTEQKINDTQREEYQSLIAQKDILKEVTADANERAARERMASQAYSNTMRGLKQELADVLTVMQTTTLDGGGFGDLVARANELRTKLKEIEESYGQFGRNVGNYQSAFQSQEFQKLTIQVNGVAREFNNAREALRTLTNERNSLSLMGQDVGDLDEVVKQLRSSIKDLDASSAGMDNLLDSMESVVALASAGSGLAAFFGYDDEKFQQTIQKLQGLQAALQGIEKLRLQMQAGDGIMGWIGKGNAAIDRYVQKLFGLDRAQRAAATSTKALSEAETAQATTTKAVDAANKVTTTSTVALSKAEESAATKAKLLSGALKTVGIGIVIAGITALMTLYDKWREKQDEAKKAQEDLNKAQEAGIEVYAKERVEMDTLLERLKNFNGTKDQEKKLLDELNTKYGDQLGKMTSLQDAYKTLKERGDDWINSMALQAIQQEALQQVITATTELIKAQMRDADDYSKWYDWLTNSTDRQNARLARKREDVAKRQKDLDKANENLAKATKQYNDKKQQTGIDPDLSGGTTGNTSGSTTAAKEQLDAERKVRELRLQLMKEGREKIIAELKEEERQALLQIRSSNSKYKAEEEKLTKELYSKKREEALKKFDEQVQNTYNKMWSDILAKDREGAKAELKLLQDANEQVQEKLAENAEYQLTYLPNFSQISKKAMEALGLTNVIPEDFQRNMQQVMELQRQLAEARKEADELLKESFGGDISPETVQRLEALNQRIEELSEKYEAAMEKAGSFGVGNEENVEKIFNENLKNLKAYYAQRLRIMQNSVAAEKKLQEDIARKQYNANLTQEDQNWVKWEQEQQDNLEKGLITQEQYQEAVDAMAEKHRQRRLQLERQYQAELQQINEEGSKKIQSIVQEQMEKTTELYNKRFAQLRNYMPNVGSGSTLKELREAKKTLDNIQSGATAGAAQASSELVDLEVKKNFNLIDEKTYNEQRERLTGLMEGLSKLWQEAEEMKEKIPELKTALVNFWVQAFGQSTSQFLDAIWQVTDANYQRRLEALQKDIDEQAKLLEQQEEQTKKYADAVSSIEDELANARGSRRQELIDHLQAQMQAQRESLAEEKRIAKEQEKMKKKAEKMDEDQKKRQKRRDITQATINAAMAISMASVNTWPIPAIPLMALAAAVGAAQIAAVAKQQYAKGGLLQGPSHKEGGIPVGATGIEVEGKEFIVRKESTTPNLPLLQYVNASKRKLTLDDFIDFYSDKKKARATMSTNKFASGGVLPVVGTTSEDRILAALDRYAERPYYVAVSEINRKQADVNRVQVLAGKR